MSDLLNQASLVYIPSGYKEDTAYSVIPTDGSGDLTFTRASDGTRVNSSGLVENVPWNLFTYSEQFENSDWLFGGLGKPTMTDNFAEAPNGTMTASKMEAASAGYQLRQNNAQENTQMNLSVWLRTNTGTKTIQLFINNGSTASQNITVTTTWTRYEINGFVTSLSGGGRNGLNTFESLTSSSYILVWGAQTNTGTTAKPYFPTTDRQNVPRLTYEGGCPSLLLEPQATALNTNSENAAGWTAVGSTITSDSTTSPSGVQNADTITYSSSGSRIQQDFTISDTKATLSVFVKSNSGDGAYLIIRNNTTATNLVTVAFTGETFTAGAGGETISYANGWYRISVTATSGISSGNTLRAYIYSDSGQGVVSGSSVYVWGMNCTNTSYLQSYIPTTSAAVTRVADLASAPQGTHGNFGTNPFCVFLDVNFAKLSSTGAIALLGNRQSSNWWRIYSNGSEFRLELNGSNGFVSDIFLNQGTLTSRTKIAFNRNGNDMKIYVNGSQTFAASSAVYSSDFTTGNTQIDFNSWYAGVYEITATEYNEVVLFKQSLTASELAALTTL